MIDEPPPAKPRRPRRSVAKPPRRGWRRLLWILAAILILAALGWIIFHPREAVKAPGGRFGASGGGPVPVVAQPAQKADVDVILDGLGTVTPLANVTVKTQIAGVMQDVAFKEGQIVRKGDFLAQIDPRPYQVQLEQAEGNLAHDQALLRQAQTDFARYQTLNREDSIARQQYEDQIYIVQQYQGTVKTDQAAIDSAKLNLAYCHIVSPVDGRVGLRQVDPGNYVQSSDPNGIVVVTQLKPISVIFALPEDNIPAIMDRLRASASLQVNALDRAQNKKLATGKLAAVDTQINTSTGTVNLRAQFDNDDERLFPNQFVNVQLYVSVLHDATVVPVSAIERGAPGTFVYLVKPDDTVTVRPVTTGPSEGERVAILSGLEPGDKVVTDGADKLREGAKITLTTPKPPAAPGVTSGAAPATAGTPQAPATSTNPATPTPPGAPATTLAPANAPAVTAPAVNETPGAAGPGSTAPAQSSTPPAAAPGTATPGTPTPGLGTPSKPKSGKGPPTQTQPGDTIQHNRQGQSPGTDTAPPDDNSGGTTPATGPHKHRRQNQNQNQNQNQDQSQ